MADITPYKVEVPQAELDAVMERLKHHTILPDELEGAGWTRGPPLTDMTRLKKYWTDEFDWRKAEAKINELPQFVTPVSVEGFGEIEVHFVHQRSHIKSAIPLLFVHGWPGSFIEVRKLLPLLAKGDGVNTPAYDVVAPSLPNFGFSQGIKSVGFDISKYAECLNALMVKLGYDEYITQGGDWGYMITRTMGLLYPERVKASHINLARPNAKPKFLTNPVLAIQERLTPHTELDKAGLQRAAWFATEGFGYNKQQSTKPQTLGYLLADSPVGLLAWIYEKLVDWTDNYPWTDDEILTWICIYQFSRAGPHASIRIYYEATHPSNGVARARAGDYIPNVPLGIARFPRELDGRPRTWNATMAPKVYQSDNARGGHFAATECPDVITADLNAMCSPGGIAHAVVKGRSGYQRLGSKL